MCVCVCVCVCVKEEGCGMVDHMVGGLGEDITAYLLQI